MAKRKRTVLIVLAATIILVLAVTALLFLPPMIALIVGGVALVIFLTAGVGRRRHHRDALSKLQADAAQRGDQGAFMGGRNDGLGGW